MNILLVALIIVESGWNPKAVSPANAVGLTQVTPIAALQVQQDNDITPHTPNLFNPMVAIEYGKAYLDYCRGLTDTRREMLSCYNGGMSAVYRDRRGLSMPKETRNYVKKVLAHRTLQRLLRRNHGPVSLDTRLRGL